MRILYATKCWKGEYPEALVRHRAAGLVVLNNLGKRIVDIGDTDDPYYAPERVAVYEAEDMGAEYILWYASDVIPPERDWTRKAIKLLADYPIVSPFWEDNYEDYVRTAEREAKGGFELTDFGFAEHCFSDHAYIAKVATMASIDYNLDHPIKELYPAHGGNSFERRVAQWLATTGQKRAVLKNHRYRHITKEQKDG